MIKLKQHDWEWFVAYSINIIAFVFGFFSKDRIIVHTVTYIMMAFIAILTFLALRENDNL